VLGDHVMNRGLWPPQFPDLNLCDFCMWGKLKDIACKQHTYVRAHARARARTHTPLEELMDNIRVKISHTVREEFCMLLEHF
jgi:hypothetical protein